eukprot:c6824_g1_i1 orf=117-344(-)
MTLCAQGGNRVLCSFLAMPSALHLIPLQGKSVKNKQSLRKAMVVYWNAPCTTSSFQLLYSFKWLTGLCHYECKLT